MVAGHEHNKSNRAVPGMIAGAYTSTLRKIAHLHKPPVEPALRLAGITPQPTTQPTPPRMNFQVIFLAAQRECRQTCRPRASYIRSFYLFPSLQLSETFPLSLWPPRVLRLVFLDDRLAISSPHLKSIGACYLSCLDFIKVLFNGGPQQ